MKVKNLANIQMGYSFRSRLDTSESGKIAVIQMKDLMDSNIVSCENLVKIDLDSIKEHHLAKKGDLVFRSRGHITTAAVLIEDPGKAVVAAPLLRIRVTNPDKIIPEYLNWYINQREAQIFLNSRAKGTVQKMISKQAIEELEVVVPTLEKQKKIVELFKLSIHEQNLLYTLAKKKEQYISISLIKFAKEE
ncbi:MAG: hypothetical protein CR982_02075 [Candidatus Cloacimonadota bacterium]|nr:MAG: hypothetical protein CR982_02075 [Candidatus Cloacimonadota bacterium]PIE78658.1 MAG: hypothetical protein CSA15_06720 [Candidatus Delongbacteria bacterium]